MQKINIFDIRLKKYKTKSKFKNQKKKIKSKQIH